MLSRLIGTVLAVCLLTTTAAYAASSASWTFASPPRGSHQRRLYHPLVRYLAQVTGHPIRFVGTRSWMVYSVDQAQGRYTFVFDGPTFTGWRDTHLYYRPLVRLSGPLAFDIVTINPKIQRLQQLDGRVVCAAALPNLATMVLMRHLSNINEPYLLRQHGIIGDYRGVITHACTATIVPALFMAGRATSRSVHVLYTSRPYRNLALSVSPQVPAGLRERIRAALLSAKGLQVLRHMYPRQPHMRFRPASVADYAPYAAALDHLPSFQYMIPQQVRSPQKGGT